MATKYGSQKVKELDQGQKIQIRQGQPGSGSIVIESPLPENFGFSAGSQFGSPFASYMSHGLGSMIGVATGFSQSYGLFTQNFFEGPQMTQVSFDMHFDTWEDSMADVILPVMYLMSFSVGAATDKLKPLAKEVASIANIPIQAILTGINTVEGTVTSGLKNTQISSNIFQMMDTPALCTLKFGNAYTLRSMFVSNVSLQFSNVLDQNYIPMNCVASVTADFKNPLSSGDIARTFGH